jgi:hypothetical protein
MGPMVTPWWESPVAAVALLAILGVLKVMGVV